MFKYNNRILSCMAKDTMEYDGIVWYRDTESNNNLLKYWHKSNGLLLHRYVYEKHYGAIPDGCVIHHLDCDYYNNDPTNLVCLTQKQHIDIHMKLNANNERFKAERKARLDKIRHLASEWHSSEEGRKWHSEHGKQIASNLKERAYNCEHCGKEFFKKPFGTNKFCSNNCKSAYRRKMGFDDVKRECVICGNVFTINKYSKTKTCCKVCKSKLMLQNREK